MTIAENLQKLDNARQSIITAINNKGVSVPDNTKFSELSTKIDDITGGGGVSKIPLTVGNKLVFNDDLMPYLDRFDFSNMTGYHYLFQAATFTNFTSNMAQILGTNPNVTNCGYMFYQCTSVQNIDLTGFNPPNTTNYQYMFAACSNLLTANLSGVTWGKATSIQRLFQSCSKLTTINNFNISGLTTCNGYNYLFYQCTDLKTINGIENWKFGKSSSTVANMFEQSGIEEIDLSGWQNTNYLTTITYMFRNCKQLRNVNVNGWNTQNVSSCMDIFAGCDALTSIDLSSWNLAKVTTATQYNTIFGIKGNTTNPPATNLTDIYFVNSDNATATKIQAAITNAGINATLHRSY